jgi:hypothetical protein
MYKLLKTQIEASTVTEKIGINYNIRPTMGYDATTKQISVKIEKIAKPDLTREEDVEVTYELLKERTFIVADFPAIKDHNNWIVEYDVINNVINDPISSWKLIADKRLTDPSFTFGHFREYLNSRWSEEIVPLFSLKSFDTSSDFTHSVLTFWVNQDDDSTTKYDTILKNKSVELMTIEQRDVYLDEFIPKVSFVVKTTDDVSVGTVTAVPPSKTGGTIFNNYTVTLPAADLYKIEITVAKEKFGDTPNTYNLTTVNGNINKNRIQIGAGTFELVLNCSGLPAGDFSKIKMNLGEFASFAELWITFS